MTPYYQDESVTVYHGDMREITPQLGRVDAVVADPPYAETALEWDVWPDGWPAVCLSVTSSLWCFGSMRMFLARHGEFTGWKMSQDIVWEKHNGSGPVKDRFNRVHENALHWYQGEWGKVWKEVPRVPGGSGKSSVTRRSPPPHLSKMGVSSYVDDGMRIVRSVIPVRSCHKSAVNETQKPEGIVAPLLLYSVPLGGVVLDPFAGSGTTGVVAKAQGKQAILIELRESQCEEIANRLSKRELFA